MALVELKSFNAPDETEHPYDKVRGDCVGLMGQDICRMTVLVGDPEAARYEQLDVESADGS